MRILLCPLASHGFVYPAIAVAQALQKRGHQVAFATGLAFQETLDSIEIPRIPRGPSDGASFQVESWFHPMLVAMQVKHIEYALGRFAPDVLVAHPLSLGALLVGERVELPVAVLGFAAHLWPASEALLHRPPASPAEKRLVWRHGDMMRHFNEARRLHKLAPSTAHSLDSPLLGDLFMLQSVPELAGDIIELPDRVHLVGACLWEPPADADLQRWLVEVEGSDEPLIYVHHGRSFDSPSFWSQVVDALADKPVRVAAAVGRMDQAASRVPANFFVRKHFCQGAVLARARMVISGGNTTVVLGALTHGLPSLLLPGGGEQPDVAEHVAKSGAGLVLQPAGATAETVGRAVDQLLRDAELTRGAEVLKRAFAHAGGPDQAARLIEHLGASRAPVLRTGSEGR